MVAVSVIVIGVLLAVLLYVYLGLEARLAEGQRATDSPCRPYDGDAEQVWADLHAFHAERSVSG